MPTGGVGRAKTCSASPPLSVHLWQAAVNYVVKIIEHGESAEIPERQWRGETELAVVAWRSGATLFVPLAELTGGEIWAMKKVQPRLACDKTK